MITEMKAEFTTERKRLNMSSNRLNSIMEALVLQAEQNTRYSAPKISVTPFSLRKGQVAKEIWTYNAGFRKNYVEWARQSCRPWMI